MTQAFPFPQPDAALPVHGGDLSAAAARWGEPAAGWLDLSTGVNPWPYPVPVLEDPCWARLPDGGADRALRSAAAAAFAAPGADWVAAAAGSGAVIGLLPRLVATSEVAVIGPTYGEHERAWRAAGHRVRVVTGLGEAAGADIAVLANPNNPDGRVVAETEIRKAAERFRLLVIDEAFADAVPELSVIRSLTDRMLVLRSFGKFYGLAGLRLGFAVAVPGVLAPLTAALGPWAVSGPALAVGTLAYEDRDWAVAMRRRLGLAAADLDRVLTGAGLTVAGGTPLFRLIETRDAHALWHRLGRAGILTRIFTGSATRLRLGLPADAAGQERLRAALG